MVDKMKGIRLGYATGPAPLIQRLEMHQQATNLHASGNLHITLFIMIHLLLCTKQISKNESILGLSQMLVFKLLSMWGVDGFKKHIAKVQQFYKQQRDFMLDAAIKHLTGIRGVVFFLKSKC
jgi:kynurenine/2-aminoadipate aminotransferase